MSEEKRKRGLGRGLSALLGDTPLDAAAPSDVKGTIQVAVGQMESGRYQPRMEFDQEALQDLADSIRAKGILQPILVRPLPEDPERYEIIAGERRWRAAQLAQVHAVPVLVRDFSDREAAEVALIENLQRRDLSPLEEAEGYRRLMNDFARTQEDLAGALGKSRSHVANMIRLLALPEPVKGFLRDGRLTAGHARALLNAEDPNALAQQVVTKGLNVRQTEKLATDKGGVKSRKPKQTKEKDSDTLALERDLARVLGLRVEVEFLGRGGHLVIHYDTLDQLDDILYRLNNPSDRHRAALSDEAPLGDDPDQDGDDLDMGNAAFAASFGRMAVAETAADDGAAAEASLGALEDSVDSWAAELSAEAEAEQEELLANPYADEEGEFQLDPEDDPEDDAADGAASDAVAAAPAPQPAEAADEQDDGEDVDTVLEASADAWGDSLLAETEAETAALVAGWDDEDDAAEPLAAADERVMVVLEDEDDQQTDQDEVEAGDEVEVEDVDALLDASADAWGDLLADETEAEREALLADVEDDEDEVSPPKDEQTETA